MVSLRNREGKAVNDEFGDEDEQEDAFVSLASDHDSDEPSDGESKPKQKKARTSKPSNLALLVPLN